MKKFLMTGILTLFATSLLVGCGDAIENESEPSEEDFMDESEVEVQVYD